MTKTLSITQARFGGELLAWLGHRFPVECGRIGIDTPLFEEGRLDSIRILELIAWTERAIGRTLPDRWIRMDYFATVRRIAETFAEEGYRALC